MRKDSLLANYYYSKLPKAKFGLETTDDKPKRKKSKLAPLIKHVSAELPRFDRKPNADYTLENATNENQRWPVNSKVMQQIIATAIGMGYDPKQALAVALQETGMGMTDPNWFHVLYTKDFPKKYRGLTEDELGIQILKDKAEYAKSLGFTNPLMQLQAYNGLGKVFRNTENKYHGFNMQKIYGVPIPPEGIDMKKNPLYAKRIQELNNNVITEDPYVNQLVEYYKNFYNNPDSRYYTKETDLNPIVIEAKKKEYGGALANYYNSRLPKAQEGTEVTTTCPEGLQWNAQRNECTTPDGRTFEELKADNAARWRNLTIGTGTAVALGTGAYIAREHPLITTLPDIIKSKNFKPYNQALLMALLQKGSYPFAKLPFVNKYYKDAAKRIGSLNPSAHRSMDDIKQAIFNNKTGDYDGFFGREWDPVTNTYVSTQPNRSLLNNYIYGDNTSFTESDVPYQNLEEYEKMYNTKKFKTYKLHDSNPNTPADINDYIFDFIIKKNSDGSLVYPELSNPDGAGASSESQKKFLYDLIKEKGSLKIGSETNLIGKDNIAGHMRTFTHDPKTGNVYLTTQDLWKFAPKKYGLKWNGWTGVKFKDFKPNANYPTPGAKAGEFLQSYSRYKQAQMMDRAGTPFVLNDKRPVDFGQDFPLEMNYADDAIPYEGPIIKPTSVSTRLSPGVIDLSKKPVSFFDDITYDVTTGRWVPKSDKSVEVGTDFIGPTLPTESPDWETVSREGYSLEEPTDYSGLDPDYKAVSDEVKSIGDVDAATWAEKYKEAIAKLPTEKLSKIKLEKGAPKKITIPIKKVSKSVTPEMIQNILKNKIYTNAKVKETPRETKNVEGLKSEEALVALRKLFGNFIKVGRKIKQEYGGDISVPNVYPNQMNPKFTYGGPLQAYYQGKMTGPNMFADGGIITDPRGQWAHPGENTRIPGGNITMDGVNYPVLAKANNGMSTMMYPGQDYNFPGASYVDEYPMMKKDGGPISDQPMSGLDWMRSWVSHSQFKDRLANMGRTENLEQEQARMMGLLDQYKPKRYRDLLKEQGLGEWIRRSIDSNGVSYGTPDQVYVKHRRGKRGRAEEESVRVHELTHMLENNGNWFNQDNKTALQENFKKFRPGLRIGKTEQDDYDYFTNPTEVHARMNQAKAYYGLTPDQEFTNEMYDEMNKKKNWFGLKKYLKNKEGFIKLINTYADNEPVENTDDYSMLRQGGVASNQGYYNTGMGIPRFDEGGEDCPCPEFNCQCPPGYGTATRPDSIRVALGALAQQNWLKQHPEYKTTTGSYAGSKNFNIFTELQNKREEPRVKNNRSYYNNIDKNKFEQREFTIGKINKNIPIGVYDRRINPTSIISMEGNMRNQDDLFYNSQEIPYGDHSYDIVEMPVYDPLAVTPWDMLPPEKQKERLKKYGTKGTPYDSKMQVKTQAKPKPKVIKPIEPTLKPRPFIPATKIPMGQPGTGLKIQLRTIPKIDFPNVNMSGPYMVGYHDYNTNEGVDRGFATAEERDAFVKELSEREGGFGHGMGNISSYYDVNKRNKKQYGGLTKYQTKGEVTEQPKDLPEVIIQAHKKTEEEKIADAKAEQMDYQTGWYNSPMYKQILNRNISKGEEWMIDEREKRLAELNNIPLFPYKNNSELGKLTADNKIFLNVGEHDDYHVGNSQTLGETLGHEWDHYINNRGQLIPKNILDFINSTRNTDPTAKKMYRDWPSFSKSPLFQKELAPYAKYDKLGKFLGEQPTITNVRELDEILRKRNEEENWIPIPKYNSKKTPLTFNMFKGFHNYYNQSGERGATEYTSLVNKIRHDAKELGVWDPFTQPFTEEIYNKMIELGNTDKTRDFRQLLNWHGTDDGGKKKTIDTFNTVVKNKNNQSSDMAKYGGGLLSKTVTCSRCGHSWKAVDGGADVATCHKCGGTIKMKHGGPLLQFYNNRIKR